MCKTLIQPHFDYACAAWYPNLSKKYKNKLQVLQNKCIRFCLQLDNREHIGNEHFDKINWLPIDQRFKQCLSTSIFKFFSEMCPQYVNKIYTRTNQNDTVTRNSFIKLFQPLRTKALSQKCLSYLGPLIWNGLPDDVIPSNNVITFKHKVKKTFLSLLRQKDQDIYVSYGYITNRNIIRTGILLVVYSHVFITPVFPLFKFKTLIFILKVPQWK